MQKFQKIFWFLFSFYAIALVIYGINKIHNISLDSSKSNLKIDKEGGSASPKNQQLDSFEKQSEFSGRTDEQAFSLLVLASQEMNKNCPLMVDNQTRLENMVALHERVVQYNYTFIKLNRNEINLKELEKSLAPQVKNNVRTNPGLREFRDLKVTFVYDYKDKLGNHVFNFSISPNEY